MGDEIVGLDPDRTMQLASACADVSGRAGELAAQVSTALDSAWLPTRGATLLSEVQDELAMLRRVIVGTLDHVRAADSWQFLRPSGSAARWITDVADRMLWDSLNDSVGVGAIEAAPFRLSESFRVMGRGEWRAATGLPGCVAFGPGRYYAGGGAMSGPDNRLYPIVVPHLAVDDRHHYTIDADIAETTMSAASLGGADPGWMLVGYRTGVERVQSEPGEWWKVATGAAVATGLSVVPGVDDAQLAGVHLRAGSAAVFLEAMPVVASTSVPEGAGAALAGPEPTVWLVVDGRAGEYPISEASDLPLSRSQRLAVPGGRDTALGRAQAVDNVFALTTQAMSGFVAARDLDRGRHRAYEVIFEENIDGRLRARVQTFTLETKQWGTELYGWHLFLDDDGAVRQSPAAYQYGPLLTSETTRLAHNPFDPDFETRLGTPAFAATTG